MKAARNTKLCFFPLPPRNDDVGLLGVIASPPQAGVAIS
jgi:hypothetical protein